MKGRRLELRPHDRSRCAEHGGVAGTDWHGVRVPPGVVMLSPPEVARNSSRTQNKGRAWEGPTKRVQGHYRGWGPTPSFTAAKRSYPSRGLLQRCYKSVYRG